MKTVKVSRAGAVGYHNCLYCGEPTTGKDEHQTLILQTQGNCVDCQRFDDLHPELCRPNDTLLFEGSELTRSRSSRMCWNCGRSTHWVDINFEAPLCSATCERVKWQQYKDALKKEK